MTPEGGLGDLIQDMLVVPVRKPLMLTPTEARRGSSSEEIERAMSHDVRTS